MTACDRLLHKHIRKQFNHGNKKRNDTAGKIGPNKENDSKVFISPALYRIMYFTSCRHFKLLAGISLLCRACCSYDIRAHLFSEKGSEVP